MIRPGLVKWIELSSVAMRLLNTHGTELSFWLVTRQDCWRRSAVALFPPGLFGGL